MGFNKHTWDEDLSDRKGLKELVKEDLRKKRKKKSEEEKENGRSD